MVDGYDKGVPSRELTYPPDKAYLKMIFLQVGYVNFLEGIYLYIYSIYQNGFFPPTNHGDRIPMVDV